MIHNLKWFKITGTYVYLIWDQILMFKTHMFHPFNPEFTIVIFTHYKPRIAAAILDL